MNNDGASINRQSQPETPNPMSHKLSRQPSEMF